MVQFQFSVKMVGGLPGSAPAKISGYFQFSVRVATRHTSGGRLLFLTQWCAEVAKILHVLAIFGTGHSLDDMTDGWSQHAVTGFVPITDTL